MGPDVREGNELHRYRKPLFLDQFKSLHPWIHEELRGKVWMVTAEIKLEQNLEKIKPGLHDQFSNVIRKAIEHRISTFMHFARGIIKDVIV